MPALATSAPVPTAALPQNLPASQVAAGIAWQAGPHSNTYGLGKGPNTYCARCHSPGNWESSAKIDPQPNCVSCKFPTDPVVRQAKGNRLVSEGDWKSIPCEQCHRPAPGGGVSKELAWRDALTGEYTDVKLSTEQCEKCHADTETLRHRRELGTPAHKGFTCTSCHNPHSAQASCTAANCHAAIKTAANPPAGHDPAHAKVDCVACHDAGGLQVGKVKETGVWTSWRSTELLGRKTNAAYASHNLGRTVDCARCHFAGNGFGLPADVKKP